MQQLKFLYICAFFDNKKLDDYISLANHFKDHIFYHIGSGDHKHIENMLRGSPVRCLGKVSEKKKNEILNKIDIYITTSIEEGFNIPILEAMEFGKAIMCRSLDVHKELFHSYPIYCNSVDDYIDEIEKIISNKKIIVDDDLGKEILNKFTWSNSVDSLNMHISEFFGKNELKKKIVFITNKQKKYVQGCNVYVNRLASHSGYKKIELSNWNASHILFFLNVIVHLFKIILYSRKILVVNVGIGLASAYILKKLKLSKHLVSIIHHETFVVRKIHQKKKKGTYLRLTHNCWLASDMIITVSQTSKKELTKYFDKDKIKVVYNGLDSK